MSMDLDRLWVGILQFGLLLLAAFFGGKISKRLNLGEVSGQIVGGVLAGPGFIAAVSNMLGNDQWLRSVGLAQMFADSSRLLSAYGELLAPMQTYLFLFLGLVVFSHGEELHLSRLRKMGAVALTITGVQAVCTVGLVSVVFYRLFGFPLLEALIVGTIALSTTPTLMFILVGRMRIEGVLRELATDIVAVNDLIEVLAFSVLATLAEVLHRTPLDPDAPASAVVATVAGNVAIAALIGGAVFVALRVTLRRPEAGRQKPLAAGGQQALSTIAGGASVPPAAQTAGEGGELGGDAGGDHVDGASGPGAGEPSVLSVVLGGSSATKLDRLIVVWAILALGLAVASRLHVPLLITALTAGILASHFHSHEVFRALRQGSAMPVFHLLFFALVGATVDVNALVQSSVPVFIVAYLVLRTIGKAGGTWLAARVLGQDRKIRACLPGLLLPQAEMAAAETILVASLLALGSEVLDTVVPSLILFSILGSYVSERALARWREWTIGEETVLRRGAYGASVDLTQLLGDRVVVMSAGSREDVIRTLVARLAADGEVQDPEITTAEVFARERLADTVIAEGVAVPHCRSATVVQPAMACGLIVPPVTWTRRHAPVGIAVLLVAPEDVPELHLAALAAVARRLSSAGVIARLRQAAKDRQPEAARDLLIADPTADVEAPH